MGNVILFGPFLLVQFLLQLVGEVYLKYDIDSSMLMLVSQFFELAKHC